MGRDIGQDSRKSRRRRKKSGCRIVPGSSHRPGDGDGVGAAFVAGGEDDVGFIAGGVARGTEGETAYFSVKQLLGQPTLADHQAQRSNRHILAWMRHDDGVFRPVAILRMAPALGHKPKSISCENADERLRGTTLGHWRDKSSGHRQLAHGHLGDLRASFLGLILQIKLHRLPQIRQGLPLRGSEARHIVINALRHEVLIFPVKRVVDLLHDIFYD